MVARRDRLLLVERLPTGQVMLGSGAAAGRRGPRPEPGMGSVRGISPCRWEGPAPPPESGGSSISVFFTDEGSGYEGGDILRFKLPEGDRVATLNNVNEGKRPLKGPGFWTLLA